LMPPTIWFSSIPPIIANMLESDRLKLKAALLTSFYFIKDHTRC
jgi:hypothetical protein